MTLQGYPSQLASERKMWYIPYLFSSSGACGTCVSYDMHLRKLLTPLSHKDLVPHLFPFQLSPLATKIMITLPKYMCCLPINETSCYCECEIHARSGALAPVFSGFENMGGSIFPELDWYGRLPDMSRTRWTIAAPSDCFVLYWSRRSLLANEEGGLV